MESRSSRRMPAQRALDTLSYSDVPRTWLFAIILCLPAHAADPATIDRALDRLYNFDFRGAHDTLDLLIAEHPADPLPYAFRASAYLFYELDRLGILESEFLIDDQRIGEKKNPPHPDAAVRAQFQEAVQDAQSRGEAILGANPNERSALFSLCIAGGLVTDYTALVEKRQFMSLSSAKRSNG